MSTFRNDDAAPAPVQGDADELTQPAEADAVLVSFEAALRRKTVRRAAPPDPDDPGPSAA